MNDKVITPEQYYESCVQSCEVFAEWVLKDIQTGDFVKARMACNSLLSQLVELLEMCGDSMELGFYD